MGTTQLIHAFGAVVIAAVLSIQFFAGSSRAQLQVHRNEILTQVGGLAAELIEEIGRRAFDYRTREDLFDTPPASAAQLTDPSGFGGVALENCDSLCRDIDDFHGLTFRKTREGHEYEVKVMVRYVDPDYPERGLRSESFAKEVILQITNPNIRRSDRPDEPMRITIGRVFTYLKTT